MHLVNNGFALAVLAGATLGFSGAAIASTAGHGYYAPGTVMYDDGHGEPDGGAHPFVASGAKWGPSQTFGTPGGTVTYSYMPTGPGCYVADLGEAPGCTITALSDFMPVGFEAAISAAFASWEAIADIQFVLVGDSGTAFDAAGATGDIRIGGHAFDGAGGVLAHGFFPQDPGSFVGRTFPGDIHFDIGDTWDLGFGGSGFDIFQVAAHEIGHAIGLRHTNVPGSLMNAFYTEAFSGPQADDIAGAQAIYGAQATPQVPVPAALPLLGSALLAFGAMRRFRRA